MQTLFYLLKFNREEICEVGTNKLFWKLAKLKWNESLLEMFQEYVPLGAKEGEYKKYQKINFLEKNLEGIVEEDVRNYSICLSQLFVCLQSLIAVRKADIFTRKAKRERLTKEREEAIQRSEERNKQREEELQAKRDEAMGVFLVYIVGLEGRNGKKGGRKESS